MKPKIGEKFNYLTAIKKLQQYIKPNRKVGGCYWLFKCDCGKEVIKRMDKVNSGITKSCGCKISRKQFSGKDNPFFKHGLYQHPFYRRWAGIKERCSNPKKQCFKYYGGRGIKNKWKSFEDFKSDMFESFNNHVEKFGSKQTTIERIDVDGNYCKENCRWATCKEQSKNKRKGGGIS